MAVGKTAAVRYIETHAPYVHISYEDNRDVLEEIRRRGLIKTRYEDYLEIQKLWLEKEIRRWEKAESYPCTIMDFGAEEIEFYTLHYSQNHWRKLGGRRAFKKRTGSREKVFPRPDSVSGRVRQCASSEKRTGSYPFQGVF